MMDANFFLIDEVTKVQLLMLCMDKKFIQIYFKILSMEIIKGNRDIKDNSIGCCVHFYIYQLSNPLSEMKLNICYLMKVKPDVTKWFLYG